MAEETVKTKKLDFSGLSWHQLMELDSCTRCGRCLQWCPVYVFDTKEDITPRAKLRAVKRIVKSQNSLIARFVNPSSWLGKIICPQPVPEEEIHKVARDLYECSTCRQCHFVCPSRIDTVELYEALRKVFVEAGYGPLDNHIGLFKSSKAYDNPWQRPRSQRARWTMIAKKEGQIKRLPQTIKRPKDIKPPMQPQKLPKEM